MVTFPCEVTFVAVSAPVFTVPVVLIIVEPQTVEAPFIVAAERVLLVSVSVVLRPTRVSVVVGKLSVPVLTMVLITGAVIVLLVKVSTASRVATTPEVGKVAVELTPVPPLATDN